MSDPTSRLNEALVGRYVVEHELGEGGMAVVYLAEDVRHHRKVALKVLKPELAAVVGADRFLAEIETTANLQHPHILPLFDSGEAQGFLFYVMPFVEGESLRAKLDREHQLPVDEAVRIATDLAEALDHAHRHGVIHRDIKPENILLQEGRPVIADFGIALAVGAAGGTRLTETGLSVGTPYYMSPEQATGDMMVGPPSDIYALGCVLYEMLIGEPPYLGATAQAVLGRIIQGRPVSATEQRSSIPENVDAVIRKALERLPADRFTAARKFGEALADPAFRHGVGREQRTSVRTWRRAALALGALSVALAAAFAWVSLRPPPPVPVVRYGIEFAPDQAPLDLYPPTLTLAPDGSSLVYVGPGGDGKGQLWVKERSRFEARALAGTEGALAPSVSPDGTWIAYLVSSPTGMQLRKVPLVGGATVSLFDSVNVLAPTPAAWLHDGTLAVADGLWRVRRVSGSPGLVDSIWTPPPNRYPFSFKVLPRGRGLLFTLCDPFCASIREIWALDFASGEAHKVVDGGVWAEYASTGHLVFVRPDGSVFAAPFALGSLQITKPPLPVLDRVKVDGGAVPDMALSADGTLLVRKGQAASPLSEFVWMTREGLATPVDSGWRFDPGDDDRGWSLSPDGTRLAARIHTAAGNDIWLKQLPDGPLSRLTFAEGEDRMPRWSSDGTFVTFLSDRGGKLDVWTKRADGVGNASLLYEHRRYVAQGFWAPGDEWLVLRTGGISGLEGGRDILAIRPDRDSVATPLMAADYDEVAPAVSPDGRWIAYTSYETGRGEVFVRPFPNVDDGKWQVSTDGGDAPLWAHHGPQLFFVDPNREVVVVQVEMGSGFRVGERRTLFRIPEDYFVPSYGGVWDLTPDDQRFLMARTAQTVDPGDRRIVLVQNWFEELEEKVASQ